MTFLLLWALQACAAPIVRKAPPIKSVQHSLAMTATTPAPGGGVSAPTMTLMRLTQTLAGNPELRRERLIAAEGDWKDGGEAVSLAALRILDELGIKASLTKVRWQTGVVLEPVPRVSGVNDMAYRFLRRDGSRLQYVPAAVSAGQKDLDKPGGFFSSYDREVNLAHLGKPSFYETALHEERHGWFDKLRRQGDVRLYHARLYAKGEGPLAPGANGNYANYFSLEELSNYPKTFRHLVQSREMGLELRPGRLVRAYRGILASVKHVVETFAPLDGVPLRGSSSGAAETRDFSVDLANFELTFPARTRPHAERQLWAMVSLLGVYAERMPALIKDYAAAMRAGDLEKARKAANKMVSLAAKLDKAFVESRDARQKPI